MASKNGPQSSDISHPPAAPKPETESTRGEGGSESVDEAGNILFVPPVDESDIISHRRKAADGGDNVLFVPPVDESDIAGHPASAEGSRGQVGEASPELEIGSATSEVAPAPAVEEVRAAIEAILYAAGEPVSIRELKKVFPDIDPEDIKKRIAELVEIYNSEGRGLQIVEVAGGYQITTRPEYHDRVSSIFKFKPPSRLTIQSLETLATIAYRQPVTIPEIMELRGVHSAGVVRTLLEKKLVRILGRKNVVGRPLLYGTTKEFLNRFGLKDLSELPRLEDMAELFGDDIALQLEEKLGGRDDSTVAASGSDGSSPEGAEPSDGGAPGATPELVPRATRLSLMMERKKKRKKQRSRNDGTTPFRNL